MTRFVFLTLILTSFSRLTLGAPGDHEPVYDINKDLDSTERKVVDWVKKYTVPNTRNAIGGAWDYKDLPPKLLNWQSFKDIKTSIKPAAWVAAVVSAYGIHEQIFHIGDFYRTPTDKGLINVRCDKCFEYPKQLPPRNNFPIEVFTMNFCQGTVKTPLPPAAYSAECSCICPGECPGKLISPNEVCYARSSAESDWQNGMFGMEQSHVGEKGGPDYVVPIAEKIYSAIRKTSVGYPDVLDNTLTVAGFPSGTQVYEHVMQCFPKDAKTRKRRYVKPGDLTWPCADLVSMWLTRNHLVGVAVALRDNDNYKFAERLPTIKTLAVYYNS